MGDTEIRSINGSELDIPLRLWRELGWEPSADYPAVIKRAFEREGTPGFRVLVQGSTVIGVILAWSHGTVGFIGYFVMLPEYRGKGYGLGMFQDTIAYLTQRGCITIGLDAV